MLIKRHDKSFIVELEDRSTWRIEDANGQAVAYTYFRRDENEARQANVLTQCEARRIAANIAKLPERLPGRARSDSPPAWYRRPTELEPSAGQRKSANGTRPLFLDGAGSRHLGVSMPWGIDAVSVARDHWPLA